MNPETALVAPSLEVIPSKDRLTSMYKMAQVLYDSGFLPAAVKSPQATFAIMQKGLELGVPPMYAFSTIAVIKGKPTAGAELLLALIYRDHGDDAYIVEETTAQRCVATYKRRSWTKRRRYEFTIEEAKQAGLVRPAEGNSEPSNWTKWPAAMLRARCASAVARMAFPDSIGGMHLPDELEAPGDVPESVPRMAEVETVQAGDHVVDIHSGEVLDVATGEVAQDRSVVDGASSGKALPAGPAVTGKASADQLQRLRKILTTLNRPIDEGIMGRLWADEVAAQIKTLAAEFNKGSKTSQAMPRPPTPAQPEPRPAVPYDEDVDLGSMWPSVLGEGGAGR